MIPFVEVDLPEIIRAVGYAGLFAIVFLESGIPIGFFFPGDSLLFTAGLLAALGVFNLPALIVIIIIAAILGDSAGYLLGKRYGRILFTKEKAMFLSKKNLERAEAFYAKHGPKAIVLARFVPVVRTFTPIFAGIAAMNYSTFVRYNIIGAVVWGAGVTTLGFFLGRLIPDIDHYLLPIILVIIFVSFLPIAIEIFKEVRAKKLAK